MFSYNTDKQEILIYDVIGESWDGEGIHAGGIDQALSEMGGRRVTVRINSPGGIADEGIAIYNTLKRYAGGVDTVIDSVAASAASIIALAGEKRTTLQGSRWMIHRAMGVGVGNANDMRRLADLLNLYDDSLADIYSNYMNGGDKAEIIAKMDSETWFSAEKAVEVGLSTGLVDGETVQKPQMAAWFEHPQTDIFEQKTVAKMRPQPVNREIARLKSRLSACKILKP